MAGSHLYAPWRMEYIAGIAKSDGCFLCEAVAAKSDQERRERLILWSSDQSIVLINRYPYTNGHLLIAPKAHKADLEDLSEAEQLDLQTQTIACIRLLKKAMSPQGFNLGINLGRCAGAGLPGHIHQHVVPRWGGDTNFMTAVGEVRVVPEAMSHLWNELMKARNEMTNE
jgi:ATP adenylyltransferase